MILLKDNFFERDFHAFNLWHRPHLEHIFFKDNYIYVTNGQMALRQSVDLHGLEDVAEILDNRTVPYGDAIKTYGMDMFEVGEETIEVFKDGASFTFKTYPLSFSQFGILESVFEMKPWKNSGLGYGISLKNLNRAYNALFTLEEDTDHQLRMDLVGDKYLPAYDITVKGFPPEKQKLIIMPVQFLT